ncbi:MAG: methylenetetrahydrofolate reductase [NAD(P)H], partial [Planctomycetaceae bacterium]|nr:methylenetetrahydrofolate reductase [NAD(P)H] [Planctomycetaceae bacterium]
MISLSELLKSKDPVISIEIFPPKTERGDELLFEMLETLAQYQPRFISCTYGAGGSTRSRTIELCQRVQSRFQIPATAHFTCVGSSQDDLDHWLKSATEAGIRNIMALRGDAPQNQAEFKPAPGGLSYASELVAFIRQRHPNLGIGVAAYPEKHPESTSAAEDLKHLKTKIDAGADAAFTQLFFDNDLFFAFRDRYTAAGCGVPLIPGIMPITEFSRIKRITEMCGSTIPQKLAGKLEAVQDDAEAQMEIGV